MPFVSSFVKRCTVVAPPTELSFATATFSIVLIFINVPGNILIILAVVLDPNKNLRSPFNWLVLNLAAADLIVGIVPQSISVFYHISEGLKRVGDQNLKILHLAYLIPCTASVLGVSSLAVERYFAVRNPLSYRAKMTNKRIVLTITMIWIISSSLPNIYHKVGFTTYAFIFANTSIVSSVVIICITFTLMRRKFAKLQYSAERRYANERSVSEEANKRASQQQQCLSDLPTASPNSITAGRHLSGTETAHCSTETNISPNHDETPQPRCSVHVNVSTSNAITVRTHLTEVKVTKMFLVVLIALLCCYGPSTILMYLVDFCEGCSCKTLHWFRDFHMLFALMNSSVNFFCYALRSSRFRNAFTKILRINRH